MDKSNKKPNKEEMQNRLKHFREIMKNQKYMTKKHAKMLVQQSRIDYINNKKGGKK